MKITGPGIGISSLPSRVKLSPELEGAIDKATSLGKSEDSTFGNLLMEKIQKVDAAQIQADQAVTEFSTGKGRNLHEAVLAMEMADTSLRLMVTVRNKALEAYQEIMRMPI